MSESKSQVKPFDIPKSMVWEAYKRVKANKGAAGVDGQSVEQFEQDLSNNLYRLWNRMSSGSYFPPPVKAVEIPKASGGVRILGVPTVADRIAQTVVAMFLERLVEPIFHPDSAPVMVTTRLLPSGYGLPHARYFIARLRGPDKYWKVTLLDGSGHKVPFRSY